MKITFEGASLNDTQSIIDNRDLAFCNDFMKYGERPGDRRPYELMKLSIEANYVFKIIADGKLVGDISVSDQGDGKYHLGCLNVIPEYENLGIGQKAVVFVSEHFPDAEVWFVETPSDNDKNQYFYKKCGFVVTDEFMDGTVKATAFEKKRIEDTPKRRPRN